MAAEEKGRVSKRSQAPKIAQGENGAVVKTAMAAAGAGVLRQWQQQSSRIFRVSRASGGKDRHSKVFTSKGLRDRRVRLSVSTAIQFYDLQDRLGYDQPSKAIEWLIQAASAAIDELPLLSNSFLHLPPDDAQPKHVEAAMNSEAADHNPPQLSMSKSGCSSNSETSNASVLSLSRSDIRVKKRKRAPNQAEHPHDINTRSSFTELLTNEASGAQIQNFPPATTVTADYFGQATQKLPYSLSSPQAQLGMLPFNIATASPADGYQSEMQHFSFMPGYMDYNPNFSMAAGLAGYQRGTLQSNSTAQLTQQHQQQHLLRFSSTPCSSMDGPNSTENYLHSGFDSRLQLSNEPATSFFLDGYRHSDVDKGKRKS